MRPRRRSLLYLVYLHSPLWRLRRRIWIIRALGGCERCGARRRLTIHHRTYERLGHERRADIAVLCWSCHRRGHAVRHAMAARKRRQTTRASGAPRNGAPAIWRLALAGLIALPVLLACASWIGHR